MLKGNARKRHVKGGAVRKDNSESPSGLNARIEEKRDCLGKILSRVRALIRQADPDATEELKWKKPSNPAGVPVWFHDGIICTGEVYKDYIKLTFVKGAELKDPACLFNSSLEGNARRAIDIREGDQIDEEAFLALVRDAVALNRTTPGSEGKRRSRTESTSTLKRPRNPMPVYVRDALNERGLMASYRARPPYQQNDYLSWIVRARLEATRQKRLNLMLEELEDGTRYMNMAWRSRGGRG